MSEKEKEKKRERIIKKEKKCGERVDRSEDLIEVRLVEVFSE